MSDDKKDPTRAQAPTDIDPVTGHRVNCASQSVLTSYPPQRQECDCGAGPIATLPVAAVYREVRAADEAQRVALAGIVGAYARSDAERQRDEAEAALMAITGNHVPDDGNDGCWWCHDRSEGHADGCAWQAARALLERRGLLPGGGR